MVDRYILNRGLPVVSELLAAIQANNLVILEMYSGFENNEAHHAHTADILVEVRTRISVLPEAKVLIHKESVLGFYMVTPTYYILTLQYSTESYGIRATVLSVLAQSILKIRRTLALCNYDPTVLLTNFGSPRLEVFKEFIEELQQHKETIEKQDALSIAEEADTSSLNNLELRAMRLCSKQKAAIPDNALRRIDDLDKLVVQVKEQLVILEASLAKLLNSHMAIENTPQSVVSNIKKSFAALVNNTSYGVALANDNILTVTIHDVIVICPLSDLMGSHNNREKSIAKQLSGSNAYIPYGTLSVRIEVGPNIPTLVFTAHEHPHVSGDRLCQDPRIIGSVSKCISTGNLMQLCKTLRAFMSSYNPGSPHNRPVDCGMPYLETLDAAKVYLERKKADEDKSDKARG